MLAMLTALTPNEEMAPCRRISASPGGLDCPTFSWASRDGLNLAGALSDAPGTSRPERSVPTLEPALVAIAEFVLVVVFGNSKRRPGRIVDAPHRGKSSQLPRVGERVSSQRFHFPPVRIVVLATRCTFVKNPVIVVGWFLRHRKRAAGGGERVPTSPPTIVGHRRDHDSVGSRFFDFCLARIRGSIPRMKVATRCPKHGVREPTVLPAGTATFARMKTNPVIPVSVNHARQTRANLVEKVGGVGGVGRPNRRVSSAPMRHGRDWDEQWSGSRKLAT